MKMKSGISLIVLIITIVVIIILAGAVILNLTDNNPIKKAKEAAFKNAVHNYKSDLSLYFSNKYLNTTGAIDLSQENYFGSLGDSAINIAIPSIKSEHIEKFEVYEGELAYIGGDLDEEKWAAELGLKINNEYSALLREAKAYDLKEHNTSSNNNSTGISPISGTFLLPYTYIDWNDKEWNEEIASWKTLGIEYIIMGDTVEKSNGTWTSYYPSTITTNMHYDALEILFKKCSEAGLKVFIGMGMDSNWWNLNLSLEADGQEFVSYCNEINPFIEEMYNKYYSRYSNTFYGFYFVPEMANPDYFDNESARTIAVNSMSQGLNLVVNKVNTLNGNLKIIISPYINLREESTWTTKSADNVEAFWTDLLTVTNFRQGDILCPQDSVGSGGMTLENLLKFTIAYKRAVINSNKGMKLWSNTELYESPISDAYNGKPDGIDYTGTATVERIINQINEVARCNERIVVFTYSNYLSKKNVVNGFLDTYTAYLNTGKLDSEKPKGPTMFKTDTINIGGNQYLQVSFSGMYDNYGISRINVYKNGSFYTYRVSTRTDENKENYALAPHSFFDKNFNLSNDSATYEIEVVDCAGNISNKTSFTVAKGSVPNGVTLGAYYLGPIAKVAPEGGTLYTDKNGDIVPIPKGFALSNVEGEKVVSTGLVIKDASGNEFVWVPICGSAYKNYYRDASRLTVDQSLPTGVDNEINQITRYGGFYIGRYEAAYDYNNGDSRVAMKKSINATSSFGNFVSNSDYNGYLWNYILSNDAKNYAEGMSTKYGYDSSIRTGLPTGKQWDSTLKWIGDTKVNSSHLWGNYKAAQAPATGGNYQFGVIQASGSNENWKANNIYDLAGNLSEWVNETYGSEYVIHDTNYSDVNAILKYYWPNSTYTYPTIGFRVVLYIK